MTKPGSPVEGRLAIFGLVGEAVKAGDGKVVEMVRGREEVGEVSRTIHEVFRNEEKDLVWEAEEGHFEF